MAPHDRDRAADTGRCVFMGCLCCYSACDCTNPLLLCKGSCDFICLRHACCCALNTPPRGCGCVGDERRGELCKVGCCCCDVGLVVPTKICSGGFQFCCCVEVMSLPCVPEYIPCPGILTLWCIPPCCCLQICPRCGCCVAPPPVSFVSCALFCHIFFAHMGSYIYLPVWYFCDTRQCPALDKFLHDNEDLAPLNMQMDDRGQGNQKPRPPALAETPASREQVPPIMKAVAAPSIPTKAPTPPPLHSSSVVTATATKATADTKVGIRLRTNKDGHVVVSAVKPNSIFAHNSALKEGMTVKRINGQAVTTAEEAVAILQQVVGPITLQCKETKKKPKKKKKRHHDNEHQKGHHHHNQSRTNQQEKEDVPMERANHHHQLPADEDDPETYIVDL